jgi:hypothetical protein
MIVATCHVTLFGCRDGGHESDLLGPTSVFALRPPFTQIGGSAIELTLILIFHSVKYMVFSF